MVLQGLMLLVHLGHLLVEVVQVEEGLNLEVAVLVLGGEVMEVMGN